MIDHLKLTKKKSLSPSVQLMTDPNNIEFVSVNHPKAQACFTRHGAQLIHFQPTDKAPVIWLSNCAIFDDNKAIRGGVPICWPWFGAPAAALGEGLSAHGFVRTMQWQVGAVDETDAGVTVTFTVTDTPASLALWPHAFELTLTATIGDTLELSLSTKNTGSESFNYLGALHTYFNISAPEKVTVKGLGQTYVDALDNRTIKNAKQELHIEGPIDSLYIDPTKKVTLIDAGLARDLQIESTGHDTIVAWTPWVAGSEKMADLPDDAYEHMLCLEAAITGTPVEVEPGKSHILSTKFS